MRLLNKFGFDDEAVSPVVGVILMVAITVILAAVIGTFVLDLGGQVQQNAQAGVSFDETEGVETEVQLNSIQTADHIFVQASADSGTPSISGGASPADAPATNFASGGEFLYANSGDDSSDSGGVGTTVTVDHSGTGDGQITVIGVVDGSENIIQTYQFTGGA